MVMARKQLGDGVIVVSMYSLVYKLFVLEENEGILSVHLTQVSPPNRLVGNSPVWGEFHPLLGKLYWEANVVVNRV